MAMLEEDWKFFTRDSQTLEMRDDVSRFCPEYDLIFIDGDHSYEGVKIDFELYKELLSNRGVILFHDIDPNHISPGDAGGGEVLKFWEELDIGAKTSIVTSKSSGKNRLCGGSEGFGGIGIWTP